jgi:hypothetical protein
MHLEISAAAIFPALSTANLNNFRFALRRHVALRPSDVSKLFGK